MALARQIRAGSAFIEVSLRNNLAKGLSNISRSLTGIGQRISIIGGGIAGVGTAAVATFAAFTKEFTEFGDHLNDLSQRIGISVRSLSGLAFAAEQSGTDIDALANGLKFMQRALGEAATKGGSAADELNAIGISAKEIISLSPDKQFIAIANALSQIENPALRNAAAAKVFGKSFLSLIQLLELGPAGILELTDRAEQLGLVLDEKAAASAARLDDAMKALLGTFRAVRIAIGESFADALSSAAESLANTVGAAANFVRENQELIRAAGKVALVVSVAGAALLGIGGTFLVAGAAISGIVGIISGVVAAFLAAPEAIAFLAANFVVLIAQTAAVGAAFLTLLHLAEPVFAALKKGSSELVKDLPSVVTALSESLLSGDASVAAEVLFATLRLEFEKGIAGLNSLWDGLKDRFLETIDAMTIGLTALLRKIPDVGRAIGRLAERENQRVTDTIAEGNKQLAILSDAIRHPSRLSNLPSAINESERQFAQLRADRARAEIDQAKGVANAKFLAQQEAARKIAAAERALDAAKQRAADAFQRFQERRALATFNRNKELEAKAIAAAKLIEQQRQRELKILARQAEVVKQADFDLLKTVEGDRQPLGGAATKIEPFGERIKKLTDGITIALQKVEGTFVGALASRSLGFVSTEDKQFQELRKVNANLVDVREAVEDNKLELAF